MRQQEIEVILTRQLAGYLAMPMAILDTEGHVVFFNEAAEAILGRRFDEVTETVTLADLPRMFQPHDEKGDPIPPETLPIRISLTERRPAHRELWIQGLDNIRRHIELIALPLLGQAGRHLGTVAILWELA